MNAELNTPLDPEVEPTHTKGAPSKPETRSGLHPAVWVGGLIAVIVILLALFGVKL
jgi:hypothetical protein